jgi:hypothetical protein
MNRNFACVLMGILLFSVCSKGDSPKISVIGARYVTLSNEQASIMPFNYDKGLTLVVLCEFPGEIRQLTGTVTNLTTDSGTNLIASPQKIHVPSYSENKKEVLFEVTASVPDANSKYFKELSGNLEWTTAESSAQTVDLGITKLTEGAKGTKFGAEIQPIEADSDGPGSKTINLYLDLPRQKIKTFKIYSPEGKLVSSKQTGYLEAEGAGTVYSLSVPNTIQSNGKIEVEMFSTLNKQSTSFKVVDFDFLGRPHS